MHKLPYLQGRSDHNTSSAMKRYVSKYDRLCGFFSLVTSIIVYGFSLLAISVMAYNNYPVKWTFLCYVTSTGWILVMNIMSNVLMLSSKKEVRRENRRTSRQTSVNLELLNSADNTRYLSRPPPGMFREMTATRLSECVSHTPPPSYEDVSKVSEENNDESFSPEGSTPQKTSLSNDEKAVYDVLESAQEMKKVSEMLKEEFGQKTVRYSHRKTNQKYSPENQVGLKFGRNDLNSCPENQDGQKSGRNSQKYSPENQDGRRSRRGLDSDKGRTVQDLDDERAKRIRVEQRRNQLDKRLEGDSLKKMNEYCMRDFKRETTFDKPSPVVGPTRQPSDVLTNPKENLRRNLKAKYSHSAENFIDIHSSRDSVASLQHKNFELPRVVHHAQSTQSLKFPRSDVTSSGHCDVQTSGYSGSHPDIRRANEVGLPLEKTWKQKLPDRTKVNLDTSFSLKHLDDRIRRDNNMCSRSRSMPGKRNSRERLDGRF